LPRKPHRHQKTTGASAAAKSLEPKTQCYPQKHAKAIKYQQKFFDFFPILSHFFVDAAKKIL